MKIKILITGAGGPAAISFFNSIPRNDYEFFMGDIDPFAAGLYLVQSENRTLLKKGDDENFLEHLLDVCSKFEIDVLVPTVDCELLKIAEAKNEFDRIGVKILSESAETLKLCLDKNTLMEKFKGKVFAPISDVLDANFNIQDCSFPLFIKPRNGSGSRGILKIETSQELNAQPKNSSLLIQEFLPGKEYSVDVIANYDGEILAAVPRERMKVDSGIAVTSRTLRNERLEIYAKVVAKMIGIKFVANIQFKLDKNGEPKLLEVNPRFPGTMPLTVKAGVNMPLIALESLLNKEFTEEIIWNEIAMVRTWQEHFVDYDEIQKIENTEFTEEKSFIPNLAIDPNIAISIRP